MERFSYYENASSDEENDSDSAIYLQDISGHINLNYDTGYDTLSNQSHSFDTGLLTPTQQAQTPQATLRGNITDTGTLTSNRSGTLRSNIDTGTLNRNTGTLQSTTGSLKSDTGTLQGSPGILKGTPGVLQSPPGILRSDTGILKSDQQGLRSDTGTLTSNRNTETKKSANDMSVTSPQLQVIPIHKDITPVGSLTPQQQQLQQYQQQQAPQSPAFPQQFGFNNNIMADISHSMLSMEQNMKRMQRQMEEQFRAMSMGSPMGPPAMMVPHPMDNFGTFPRIKSPFNPAEQQDDRLLSIAGGPRSPAPSTVSTIGPSSVSSLSPPSPSISSSTTTEDPGVIMDRNGKKHLKMQFDMQDFKPEEVQVKKDRNRLEVSALHEEKEPNRVSCRVFHQQYHLPKDVRLTKVDSKFSPDGTLTVESAVKPRHRVKFAMEDGANPPQLAIEPPTPQHSGNTDVLVTGYPNGVNGTPPFPVQEKQRRQKQRDDRQGEVQFKVDNRNRTRELTPEDDYEWPDYQPPKVDYQPQKVDYQSQKVDYPQRHDQHQQQQHMDFPPQRNDYHSSHRPEYQQQQQQREQPRVEFQQPPRKDYTPPHSEFQVQQPVRNDYKHKTKSLDRRQVQRQNSARLKDYQQEDAYVRGLELGRQPELGEGVAQVYVSNTPSTMDRPMSADHGSASRSYGTLNRSRSPPKPPKRTDSSRYNTLPNRKLASDGQSQRIHDGFTSLQRPPPPNYHQLSYLQLNGDVSPAPSSSSGSTVATAYNTYYHPHHGHHHHRK